MSTENEHDFTKLMLETIRAKSSDHKTMLRENEGGGDAGGSFGGIAQSPEGGGSIESNIDNIEENEEETDAEATEENPTEDSDGLDTSEGKEEEQKLKDMVSKMITLQTFKIHPDNANVVMSGTFQDVDIDWQLSKNDGFFINADNVEFTDEVSESIDKLGKYYKNWKDKWGEQIEEYTQKEE